MTAPLPKNETARLEALRAYQLLDSAPEPIFDDIATLASYIASTPIAILTLIDQDRQWFKAKVGLAVSETPREQAFCAHTILKKTPLLVKDASKDDRFSSNPLVTGSPHIRFYAGLPLCNSEGYALGSLCVIDRMPRELTDEQSQAFAALARQTMAFIESRRVSAQLADAVAKVKTLNSLLPICCYCRQIRDDDGYWEQVEGYVHKHTDSRFSHGICPNCMKTHFPDIPFDETSDAA